MTSSLIDIANALFGIVFKELTPKNKQSFTTKHILECRIDA
jgi:hypothetical protein